MKRAERGSARAAEQVFRTRELMLSSPVAESECRVARNFSPFSGGKDNSGAIGYDWEGWLQSAEKWVWDQRFQSNRRIEAFSLLTSGVGCDAV